LRFGGRGANGRDIYFLGLLAEHLGLCRSWGSVVILFVLFLNMCAYIHTQFIILLCGYVSKRKNGGLEPSRHYIHTFIYIYMSEYLKAFLDIKKDERERKRETRAETTQDIIFGC